jgi:MFS family permease
MRALWAERAYLHLWAARVLGTSAQQMLLVALGWQMYELTASAWDLGLLGLLQFVPAMLLALPAGQTVDRRHRARLLAATLAVQALLALLLGAAHAGGWIDRRLLLGAAVVLGAVRAFQMPAQQALTPALVPPRLLARALAFSSIGLQSAIIAGPAVGGFAYLAGATVAYALAGALFVAGTAFALAIRHEHDTPTHPATFDSLTAGLRFVWQRPLVLGATTLDLFAVLMGSVAALLPVFAKDVLHTGAWGLGLLRAAPAVGALAMALVITRWPVRRRAGPLLMAGVAVYGVATLGFALSTALWLSLATLALAGAADMISIVVRQSLVQLETPDPMRGRVSAVNSLFIGASNQLGEFRAGAAAALVGAPAAAAAGALATLLVVAAWWRLFPALATRDRLVDHRPPEPREPSPTSR